MLGKLILLLMATVCLSDLENTERYTIKIFMSDECVISKYYMPLLKELHEDFANDTIVFEGIFPNLSSKKDKIQAFKEKHKTPFEFKTDYFKKQSTKYGITKVPEVLVLSPQGDILYKGRIDNSFYQLGKRRRVVTKHELKTILLAISRGDTITVKSTEAIGCFINYTEL